MTACAAALSGPVPRQQRSVRGRWWCQPPGLAHGPRGGPPWCRAGTRPSCRPYRWRGRRPAGLRAAWPGRVRGGGAAGRQRRHLADPQRWPGAVPRRSHQRLDRGRRAGRACSCRRADCWWPAGRGGVLHRPERGQRRDGLRGGARPPGSGHGDPGG